MIGALRGKVMSLQGDTLLLDVNGVGYELTVTGSVICQAARDEISVRVYTDVREQAIVLFGFLTALEREVFLLIKKVKGIGPKGAMSVVSYLGAEGVLSAIGREDIDSFKKVPGIGKKTAERMIVELRESVESYLTEDISSPKTSGSELSGRIEIVRRASSDASSEESDVLLALEKLGFSRASARDALTAATKTLGNDVASGELLKVALASLHSQ